MVLVEAPHLVSTKVRAAEGDAVLRSLVVPVRIRLERRTLVRVDWISSVGWISMFKYPKLPTLAKEFSRRLCQPLSGDGSCRFD